MLSQRDSTRRLLRFVVYWHRGRQTVTATRVPDAYWSCSGAVRRGVVQPMRPHLRFAIGLKVGAEVSRETVLDSCAEPKSRTESDVGVSGLRPGILRSGLADSDAVLMSSANPSQDSRLVGR